MAERWKEIENFPNYSVSDYGRVRSEKSGKILEFSQNQSGLVHVGLMRDGYQYHRSVPLLVSKAFLAPLSEIFDTPVNKDGDRANNALENLLWRPRWYAIKYHQQFYAPSLHSIDFSIENIETGEIFENSFECAKHYGILEIDLVLSIYNKTSVWPINQRFRVIEN